MFAKGLAGYSYFCCGPSSKAPPDLKTDQSVLILQNPQNLLNPPNQQRLGVGNRQAITLLAPEDPLSHLNAQFPVGIDFTGIALLKYGKRFYAID
jgi:hypothetical protein